MASGVNPRGCLEEARFYGFQSLVDHLEQLVEREAERFGADPSARPLTRRDVVAALIGTSTTSELRFQGVNLEGADLSKLDLR